MTEESDAMPSGHTVAHQSVRLSDGLKNYPRVLEASQCLGKVTLDSCSALYRLVQPRITLFMRVSRVLLGLHYDSNIDFLIILYFTCLYFDEQIEQFLNMFLNFK